MSNAFLVVVDRDSQEFQKIKKLLIDNDFKLNAPPDSYCFLLNIAVFMIYMHNMRATVKFLDRYNFDCEYWRGFIFNVITSRELQYILAKKGKTQVWVDEYQQMEQTK